jgi:hypothetical protein
MGKSRDRISTGMRCQKRRGGLIYEVKGVLYFGDDLKWVEIAPRGKTGAGATQRIEDKKKTRSLIWIKE